MAKQMNSDIHSISLLHIFFIFQSRTHTLYSARDELFTEYVICLLPDSNVNDSADSLNLENWKPRIPSDPGILTQPFCSLKDLSYVPQLYLFQREKKPVSYQVLPPNMY